MRKKRELCHLGILYSERNKEELDIKEETQRETLPLHNLGASNTTSALLIMTSGKGRSLLQFNCPTFCSRSKPSLSMTCNTHTEGMENYMMHYLPT
jgi:hypothetical protein